MGQKAKNAGKKKQAPAKVKVCCIPRDTAFKITDTPEAHYTLRELLSFDNITLKGKKSSHKHKNYNVNRRCAIRIPTDD